MRARWLIAGSVFSLEVEQETDLLGIEIALKTKRECRHHQRSVGRRHNNGGISVFPKFRFFLCQFVSKPDMIEEPLNPFPNFPRIGVHSHFPFPRRGIR